MPAQSHTERMTFGGVRHVRHHATDENAPITLRNVPNFVKNAKMDNFIVRDEKTRQNRLKCVE